MVRYLVNPQFDGVLIFMVLCIALPVGVVLTLGSLGYYDVKPTPREIILNDLSCNELKEWVKYNLDSNIAVNIYSKKCLEDKPQV